MQLETYQERTTRSKTVFSPYGLPQVIYATTGFKVEDGLREVEVARLAKEERGVDEFEGFEGAVEAEEGDVGLPEATAGVNAPDSSFEDSTAVPAEEDGIKSQKAIDVAVNSTPILAGAEQPEGTVRICKLQPAATCAVKPSAPATARAELPEANIEADGAGLPRKRFAQTLVKDGAPKLAKTEHPVQEKQWHAKAEKRDWQKQTHGRPKRREAREALREQSGLPFKGITIKKGLGSLSAHTISAELPSEKVRVVRTGYTGARQGQRGKVTHTLDEAKREGLNNAGWDGKMTCLLATANGTVVGICYPPNAKSTQLEEQEKMGAETLEHLTKTVHLSPKEMCNNRGTSPALARGISHGGGQEEPTMCCHSRTVNEALDRLASLPIFNRYSGTTNHCLKFYAPNAHELQEDKLKKLLQHHPHLKQNFNDTVFTACTWNIGPQFVSYPHIDSNNYPFTWCAITAMGDFNPDLGGHLILWDLGIYIRFPPGATILIPSALLVHSNVSVHPGEKRYSFVQYTAGALLRWVANSFQTQDQWEANASDDMKALRRRENKDRVANGLSMFSTVEELQKRYSSFIQK
ncbi:hypothetical protein PQX77_012571 [Marasmius sp. AFHP31]|nr:hypothetical protein PQX77_012571 [Marasmius sp. AFHP31]